MFKPKFCITPEINSKIAEIEHFRAIVERASILPELEIHLRLRASVESVHSSTSIEGNPLNELQVENVLRGKIVHAPDYAIIEVKNYKKALDWIMNFSKPLEKLTTKDVLVIHKLVMKDLLPNGKVGHFRPGSVYIINEQEKEETVEYVGPDAKNVPRLISSLLTWTQKQSRGPIHPVLLASLVHYLFVSIHPFSDGNGRTTRLLTLLILRLLKYDFRGTISLDSYYLQHQLDYYKALSRSNTFEGRINSDITPFIEFFTEGFLTIVKSLQQYIEIGKVQDDNVNPIRLNADELSILDYTHQFGAIKAADVVDILKIPKRTAQRRLQELVEKGILHRINLGPASKYILEPFPQEK